MPVTALKTVVLPAPLGPITEKIWPFSTEKLTWLTGMRTMTTAGDVNTQVGMASHIYLVTQSMQDGDVGGGRGVFRDQLDAEEALLLAREAGALLHRIARGERRFTRPEVELSAIRIRQEQRAIGRQHEAERLCLERRSGERQRPRTYCTPDHIPRR